MALNESNTRRTLLRGTAAAALVATLAPGRLRGVDAAPVPELLKDVTNPINATTGVEIYSEGTPWQVLNRVNSPPRRGVVAYVGGAFPPAAGGDEAVAAFAPNGLGVRAETEGGVAVGASATSGIGLSASANANGRALVANGRVSFSSAGSGKFTKGQSQATVSGVTTPPSAKILVTLSQNPGKDNALKYVRRASDSSFTAFLAKPVTGVVRFAYFVIE